MNPHDGQLMRDCPECGGDGVAWDLATIDHPEPTCGVCLGDGRLVTAQGLEVHAITAAAANPDRPPPAPVRYVDHSGHTHRCVRCTQPDHIAPPRWITICALGLSVAVLAHTVGGVISLFDATPYGSPDGGFAGLVLPFASIGVLLVLWLASRAVTR